MIIVHSFPFSVHTKQELTQQIDGKKQKSIICKFLYLLFSFFFINIYRWIYIHIAYLSWIAGKYLSINGCSKIYIQCKTVSEILPENIIMK